MRKTRKPLEKFFCQKIIEYIRQEIDPQVVEIPGISDKPDLAVSCRGRVIGIELTQFPSDYIIRWFHKKRPAAKKAKDIIEGRRTIFPFEPHRWVYEVIKKKSNRADNYRKNIGPDEMWLVMHSHSTKNSWPMSKVENTNGRLADAFLMRFGLQKSRHDFDKIFFVYADGEVVELTDDTEPTPEAISHQDDTGYPALTSHLFSMRFDVPLPGLGTREYRFDEIDFKETIVPPKDEWIANRPPAIGRSKFSAKASVNSETYNWRIFIDEIPQEKIEGIVPQNKIGKPLYLHVYVQSDIQATFTIKLKD